MTISIREVLQKTEYRAIEDGFPLETISRLAQHESWRKEIYRPIYYIHKWWARRLGSVFRAIILSCCVSKGEAVETLFYTPISFPDVVVFDPFMGSGTTVGEALKLGCRAIGRDINPVAVGMVTAALQEYSRREVIQTYRQLESSVGERIKSFYKTILSTGEQADVLYYFWVKTVPCPVCEHVVELFKSRLFAKHAYPTRHPEAKSVCPRCEAINDIKYSDLETKCDKCGFSYNPHSGSVNGGIATCPACKAEFKIIDAVRRMRCPPSHKMYAKMVLTNTGEKVYLPICDYDRELYRQAEVALENLWKYIPSSPIMPGYNTNQVLNYNYTHWHQMFNARQLAVIAMLASEIRKISSPHLRRLFAFLFSGVLEFNNMFCSFKGEGTGAVRHMFSHHILKPELMPIEANLWGTPKSSGAFSTLFRRRVLRLLDYKDSPFELQLVERNGKFYSKKIFDLSQPMNYNIAESYQEFASSGSSVYLSCGDSANTDIQDASVDLVVTDPPFFDNVHYSQLADFFFVWLREILSDKSYFLTDTTRSSQEVQDTEAEAFAVKLGSVFRECHRVLKDEGLLVFTYHHSRVEGWSSVYRAIRESGFYVTYSHPVKAEMAVSVPIQQANVPVNFDLIIVCRKLPPNLSSVEHDGVPLLNCIGETKRIIRRLKDASIKVSLGDAKVMFMGSVLSRLIAINNLSEEIATIYEIESKADSIVEEIVREIGA